MNSANLPLPLQLTKPVLLAADLDTQVRDGSSDTYDAKAQLCGGSSSRSTNNSKTLSLGLVQDVVGDNQIDDVIAG